MTISVTQEQLETIIKNSISWSEAMRKCGRTPRGASFQYFQSRVRKLGIDTSHFLGKAAHAGERGSGKSTKKTWESVLIKRNTLDRESTKILRRAFSEYCKYKGIENRCSRCSNEGIWFGKVLKLEVDHKDGCRWNNEPTNLEWLCPNCHSIK